MIQNFLGHPCLDMMERGEDWKWPNICSIKWRGKGPMYCPLSNSLQMMVLKSAAYVITELLLGGDCVRDGGKVNYETIS